MDLGSDTVKIYSLKKDEILIEKNMIAIRNGDEVIAIGNDAYEMYEKSPHNIEVSSPMSGGMIANIGHLEVVLQLLLRKISRYFGSRPIVYFSVPMNMTEIEKKSLSCGSQRRRSAKEPPCIWWNGPSSTRWRWEFPSPKQRVYDYRYGRSVHGTFHHRGQPGYHQQTAGQRREFHRRRHCGQCEKALRTAYQRRTAARLKAAMAGFSLEKSEARKVVGVDTVSGP